MLAILASTTIVTITHRQGGKGSKRRSHRYFQEGNGRAMEGFDTMKALGKTVTLADVIRLLRCIILLVGLPLYICSHSKNQGSLSLRSKHSPFFAALYIL